MYNLPNLLTISRILVIPVIFLSIYIHAAWWSMLSGVLFIIAAVTDYFDGYLARANNQTSVFGRLLDPIADKLLVASALIVILATDMVHPFNYIPVIVILCREILVSGLREFLAEGHVGMPVTRLAKWKTGFQMTALSMILVGGMWHNLGVVLLWVAGVLTFWTGYQYYLKSLEYVKTVDSKKQSAAEVKTVKAEVKKPIKTAAKKAPKAKKTK